ncbi:MAG: hypothetical protein ACRC8A_20865 [Microcoleaceae cyanobacterium]
MTEVSTFNESMYRAFYNDLDALIPSTYATGEAHFQAVGQFFGPNKKEGFFTGGSGNEIVTGFGDDTDFYGVAITATFTPGSGPNGPAVFTPASFGVGERDILVGENSPLKENGFFLSVPNGEYSRTGATTGMLFGESDRLYVGQGNKDFARVVNFNIEYDYVSLSGAPQDYIYKYQKDSSSPDGYSLKIYTKAEKDLVGIVQEIDNVQPRNFLNDNTFRLSGRVPERGFNDEVYDLLNGVSGGLEHYVKNSGSRHQGVFSGAAAGSPTLNSSTPANGNDTLITHGKKTLISGVELSVSEDIIEAGTGTGQKDVLVGSLDGSDQFLLGFGSATSAPTAFYLGNGSADYALIQNYQKSDRVLLAGDRDDYSFVPNSGNLEISQGGDLIAIIEGVSGISNVRSTTFNGASMSAAGFV